MQASSTSRGIFGAALHQGSSGMVFSCPRAGDAIDGDHRQNDRAGVTYEYDIIAANQIPNKFAAVT